MKEGGRGGKKEDGQEGEKREESGDSIHNKVYKHG